MFDAVTLHEILNSNVPLLDVRSPGEYAIGHIPGATSFPLFSDEERAEIGTLYKQVGKKVAVRRGLELIGPRLHTYTDRVDAMQASKVYLYCWRGGMRSGSIAWLLKTYGIDAELIPGGYKAYQGALKDYWKSGLNLQVLCGLTGTRKTEILHALKEAGQQVIDLEGAAGHKGSSFGNAACNVQPKTEHFHNLVFEQCLNYDLSQPIWIEDESFMIGQVGCPEELFILKEKSPHYHLDRNLEERSDALARDYGTISSELLIQATEGIRKRLGHARADEAIRHIQNLELKEAVKIILHYYDKRYSRGIEKKKNLIQHRIDISNMPMEQIVSELLQAQPV